MCQPCPFLVQQAESKTLASTKVKACYKQRAARYVGVVKKVNKNGTYQFAFEDGEVLLAVHPSKVFALDGSSEESTLSSVV